MKAKKKDKTKYTVICGCDTADGVRYEIGDAYSSADHDESITAALLKMNCLETSAEPEAIDGDS